MRASLKEFLCRVLCSSDMPRTYDDELKYLERLSPYSWRIKKGFVNNMKPKVEGIFYVNSLLEKLMFDELRNFCRSGDYGGFLPGMKQIANVASLPGIVHRSVGLPDVHSGYGFAIGNRSPTSFLYLPSIFYLPKTVICYSYYRPPFI
ncbi:unnamed protein product [Protopolystoma xenopodis]|uniref:3'-phosphate/5'-hydroxy nucleic acid ligase n=1 Tax=Protopolystoma xenopodis TaxID=117903 RepID=A0A448X171_9PLAT|nr:unnamed protein product [Protopolystoma xenopodis]